MKIYNEFFKEGEEVQFSKAVEKEDDGFKERLEKIKKDHIEIRLNALQERVDKNSDNFEKRYEAFKKAVLQEEKEQNPIDAAKQKAKEEAIKQLEEKKQEGYKKLREEADKKLPFGMGVALFDWAKNKVENQDKGSGFMGKIFSNIWAKIGIAIIGMFGFKEAFGKIKDMKIDNIGENVSKLANQVKNVPQELSTDLSKKAKNFEMMEKGGLSKLGFNIIKGFSGVIFEKNEKGEDVYDLVKNKKQNEIEGILAGCINSNEKPIPEKINELPAKLGINRDGNEIFNVISSMSNKYANIVYSQRLSSDNLKKLLLGEDKKVKKRYARLFSQDEIELIENGNIDYKNLKIETICLLLPLSFGGLLSGGVSKLEEIGIDSFKYLTSESEIGEEFKKELENRKNDYISLSFIQELPKGAKEVGISYESLEKNTKYQSYLSTIDGDKKDFEIEKIKKFFTFKDSLLKFAKENVSIKFGVKEFDEGFNESINFERLYVLYLLMDGDNNFPEIIGSKNGGDSLKKSMLIMWLGDTIGSKQVQIKTKYYIEIASLLVKKVDGDKFNIFSENDKLLLASISSKIGDYLLGGIERNIKSIDQAILTGFSKLLIELGVSKEYSEILVRALEVGGVAFLFVTFRRLNSVAKWAIGTSVMLPIMIFLVQNLTLKGIKDMVDENMYRGIQEFAKGEINDNGTKIPFRSLEDIEQYNNNKQEYINKTKEVQKEEIQGVIIEYSLVKGLKVNYNGINYNLEIGPNLLSNADGVFSIDGYKFDTMVVYRDGELLKIGIAPNIITIPIQLIVNKIKEQQINNSNGKEYITLIEGKKFRENNDYSIESLKELYAKIFEQNNIILVKNKT